MKETFATINHAIGHSRFKDADVKRELIKLLNLLEADLGILDYEPSSKVEESVEELADTLDEIEKKEAEEVEVSSPPSKIKKDVEVNEEDDVDVEAPKIIEVEDEDVEIVGKEKPEEIVEDNNNGTAE